MRRRKRNKRQVQIVIGLALCFLFVMTVGYAAFSTNLTLSAKGNINDYNAAWQLKKNIVTSGEGLYEDRYDLGRYIYRGEKPNNYIKFNNELWLIVAVEKDGILKIMKNSPATNLINFDDNVVSRYSADGWCNDSSGCNFWSSQKNTYDASGSLVTKINIGDVDYSIPSDDSKANRYLNSTDEYVNSGFYFNLDDKSKQLIVTHDFYVGPISNDHNIELSAQQEKKYIWRGTVGLLNASDFFQTVINSSSYLNNLDRWYWLMTAPFNSRTLLSSVGASDFVYGTVYYGKGSSVGLIPVVYLKSDIKLAGDGSFENPYIIK